MCRYEYKVYRYFFYFNDYILIYNVICVRFKFIIILILKLKLYYNAVSSDNGKIVEIFIQTT